MTTAASSSVGSTILSTVESAASAAVSPLIGPAIAAGVSLVASGAQALESFIAGKITGDQFAAQVDSANQSFQKTMANLPKVLASDDAAADAAALKLPDAVPSAIPAATTQPLPAAKPLPAS